MKNIIFNRKFVVAILLLAFTLPACDYLSIAPENELIKEKFWAKKEDADGALASAYDAIRDASLKSLIMGEVRADISIFGGSVFSNYARIGASDITSTNGEINWSKYYEAINLSNTLMYYMPEVMAKDNSFTEQLMKEYTSEALFIRALSYFYLVRIWKQVPLVINASISDEEDLFLPKNTEKEVITQIIADLKLAKETAVSEKYKNDPVYYKGRANIHSINALLADVYLWNEQYQECVDICNEVMNTGLFMLEDYNNWFNIYYPGNSMTESIFELQYDDILEGQQNPIHNDLIPVNKGAQVAFNGLTLGILFNIEQDQRIKKLPSGKYQLTSIQGSSRRQTSQKGTNMIVYRYADILLMKAEALCEMNKLIEANALVRITAERSGVVHTDIIKQSALRKEILNERAREFTLEGKRWFDVLRSAKRNDFENKQLLINMILSGATDVKQQAILRTKVYDTMSYYLPVPENEILYNPQLEQNPFYDR